MTYSLDFWGTLGIPHPKYAIARTEYLSRISGLREEVVKFKYSRIKKELDNLETSNTEYCYKRLMEELDLKENPREEFNRLFALYPASIPWPVVEKITSWRSISIGSNTNFITGRMIRKYVFDPIGLKFQFEIFSDEIGYNKPSVKFFKQVKIHGGANITHIGDSEYFDGGAAQFGIKTHIIKHPLDIIHL